MEIKGYQGFELEKEKSNSPEDYFNRSEVTFVKNGEERTFFLLYVRYFEEKLIEDLKGNPFWKPYLDNIKIRDIAALTLLTYNENYQQRKRIYINDYSEMQQAFLKPNESVLKDVFEKINAI